MLLGFILLPNILHVDFPAPDLSVKDGILIPMNGFVDYFTTHQLPTQKKKHMKSMFCHVLYTPEIFFERHPVVAHH
jgi:hypothetical protein